MHVRPHQKPCVLFKLNFRLFGWNKTVVLLFRLVDFRPVDVRLVDFRPPLTRQLSFDVWVFLEFDSSLKSRSDFLGLI